MHHDVGQLKHNAAHVLLSEHALLGGPLHRGIARVLDLVQVLHTLARVHHQVGAGRVRAKAPNLLGQVLVPAILLRQHLGADLGVIARANLALVNDLGQAVLQRPRLHVDAVVLVGRLGQARLVGLLGDGLAVGHHGVADDEVALGVLVLQIFEADLHVQLATAGDDVFAALLGGANHQGVRLGQLLQTLHQLWKVLTILCFYGHLHNRRHAVLHVSDVVGILERGNGS
mmetsp:Transcript_35988/g.77708  ORF Transcript_35988/g.77708 Transcript_35988/m.77708 type:complete len:229 (+) Transcript_35988:606-1292(+)